MPDSKVVPNGKYGFVGHTTLETMNIPPGLTIRDMRHLVAKVFGNKTMKLRAPGEAPSAKVLLDRLAKNPKIKRTWFDGCKFEVLGHIDSKVGVTTAVIMRFPQTEKHPDLKTPIVVPDEVRHQVSMRVNGMKLPDMKIHNRTVFYLLESTSEYDIRCSIHFRIYGDSVDMAMRDVVGAKGIKQRAHVDLTAAEWDLEPYNGEQVICWK